MSSKSFGPGMKVLAVQNGQATQYGAQTLSLNAALPIRQGMQIDDVVLSIGVLVTGTKGAAGTATHLVSEVPNRIKIRTMAGEQVLEQATLADVAALAGVLQTPFPQVAALADHMTDPAIADAGVLYTGQYRIPQSVGGGMLEVEMNTIDMASLFADWETVSDVKVTLQLKAHLVEDDGTENILLQARKINGQPSAMIDSADTIALIGAATMASLNLSAKDYDGNVTIEPTAIQVAANELEYSARLAAAFSRKVQIYAYGAPLMTDVQNPNALRMTAVRMVKVR